MLGDNPRRHVKEIEKLNEYVKTGKILNYELKENKLIIELYNDLYKIVVTHEIDIPNDYLYKKKIYINGLEYKFNISKLIIDFIFDNYPILNNKIDYIDELISFGIKFIIINVNLLNITYKDREYVLNLINKHTGYISINNINLLYNEELNLVENIMKFIDNNDKIKILIYCHPYNIKFEDNNTPDKYVHYDIDIIRKYTYEYTQREKEYDLFTIDNKNGGTIMTDGFSDDFYLFFSNFFDIVFLPDCGGNWYYYQESGEFDKFINIIENTKRIVKGKVIFSKIINDDFLEKLKGMYKFDYINKNHLYFIY